MGGRKGGWMMDVSMIGRIDGWMDGWMKGKMDSRVI